MSFLTEDRQLTTQQNPDKRLPCNHRGHIWHTWKAINHKKCTVWFVSNSPSIVANEFHGSKYLSNSAWDKDSTTKKLRNKIDFIDHINDLFFKSQKFCLLSLNFKIVDIVLKKNFLQIKRLDSNNSQIN